MHSWFIQQNYAFRSALRRLYIQPFSSLANLFVISIVLVVPLLSASVLISLKPITAQINTQTEITLFAKNNVSNKDLEQLAKNIQSQYQSAVADVTIISKEQALNSLKGIPAWDTAIDVLDSNPLPDSLVVTLKDDIDKNKTAIDLHDQWSKLEYIDSVQLDQQWIKYISSIINFLESSLFALSIGFAIVITSTVFNTVRMQALALHEEISVMRTVGATESFVRRPFLYLGALIGLISGVFSIVVTKLIITITKSHIHDFSQLYGTNIKIQLPSFSLLAFALLIVMLLSSIAARWSVKAAK